MASIRMHLLLRNRQRNISLKCLLGVILISSPIRTGLQVHYVSASLVYWPHNSRLTLNKDCQVIKAIPLPESPLMDTTKPRPGNAVGFDVRPHRALKFGTEIRTPAMQAGLAKRRFSFRDVFTFLFAIFWIRQLESNPKSELDLLGITYLIHSWWRKHLISRNPKWTFHHVNQFELDLSHSA